MTVNRFLISWALLVLVGSAALAQVDEAPQVERLKYNHPGLKVDLGVGLWAWPLPLDYDQDGDLDLIVSCPDVPYDGVYLFENPDGPDVRMPVFKPPVRLNSRLKNVTVSHIDGKPRVLTPGEELLDVVGGRFSKRKKIYPRSMMVDKAGGRVRANQWGYVDFDGDGALDLFAGMGWWGDYGWDNAFNEKGEWTRGPLRGNVYIARNTGSSDNPKYAAPKPLQADGRDVDVFGMPSPNFADFDGDGDLDLICGEFLDGFTYFENTGSRTAPRYAVGRRPLRSGKPLKMHLCMIVVSSVDWDRDGHPDLIVGQEDGRVALVRHSGKMKDGAPLFEAPQFFQQEADEVKFGALVTPVSVDWDNDGDEDLVCGNTAGEIGLIENLDGGDPPRWAAPKLLQVDGQAIRILAGPNGSIQGPAEAKWGYTTIDVADWDHDGRLDILANSIWGKVVWYRNVGTAKAPRLEAARPIDVAWKGEAPRPAWNWWSPQGNALATQWRTTPCVVDWNGDGLNDLLMLDHEGYLALFQRSKKADGGLILQPGKRQFVGGVFDSRHASKGKATDRLQLNNRTAGGSGRRKLCVVDWNRDGKLDVLVNSVNIHALIQESSKDGMTTFRSTGPLVRNRLAGHTTSPTTVDWDGDGKRELLIGAEDGLFYYEPKTKASR